MKNIICRKGKKHQKANIDGVFQDGCEHKNLRHYGSEGGFCPDCHVAFCRSGVCIIDDYHGTYPPYKS